LHRRPDRLRVQRQVAADPRTVHATAALVRHALPVCRVMALAAGRPPAGGGLRRGSPRVVPFFGRETDRGTSGGGRSALWRASLMELSSEEPTNAEAGRVVCTSGVPPPSLRASVRPSAAGSNDEVAANRPLAVTRN